MAGLPDFISSLSFLIEKNLSPNGWRVCDVPPKAEIWVSDRRERTAVTTAITIMPVSFIVLLTPPEVQDVS